MGKKAILQFFLTFVLILISYFTYSFYYKKDDQNLPRAKKELYEKNNINESQNLIQDIKYTSSNVQGDIYEILAEFGESSLENPDLMFLRNVTANIIFKKKENIQVVADFANFNTITFETTFINNVKVVRDKEIITGNELYLVLDLNEEIITNNQDKDQNLIRMTDNILFEKPGYSLKADILEIDLISKDIKIFMNKKETKVIATSEIK